jgi:hypothetical protein
MSTTIVLPEINTLKSQSVKYIVEKIGINIRPLEPYYVEKEDVWKIPCKAIIPNYVRNREEEGKTFLYTFDNICELVYKQINNEYKLINSPSANEIEINLSRKLVDLTYLVERELLKCGKNSWGKLTLIKQYLSPLYSMVTFLIDEGELPKYLIKTNKKLNKYTQLLIFSDYMKIDNSNSDAFIESNKLIKLKERIFESDHKYSPMALTENIIGQIYSENYDVIKYDMNITSPSSYVDTTKIYYFNALKYGENIRFTEKDFVKNFKFYGNLLNSPRDLNFKNSLFELTEYELLKKASKYYYGNEQIYEHLYEFKNTLLTGGNEIY